MGRPRTLHSHSREFFALTEDLLTVPAQTRECPSLSSAFTVRAGMYHFWARYRKTVEDCGFRPPDLETLAQSLQAAGKLHEGGDGALIRALYRVACNTSISVEGKGTVRFHPKSESSVSRILSQAMTLPPEPVGDGGAGLLAQLERKLD